MKIEDIKAILNPAVVERIDARAKTMGIPDPWQTAIDQANATPTANAGHALALAVGRVQQLVALIPSFADAKQLRAAAAGTAPQTWLERNPVPVEVAPVEEVKTEAIPADPAPAPAAKKGGKSSDVSPAQPPAGAPVVDATSAA